MVATIFRRLTLNEKIIKTLNKIGTVLVDRRFWVAFSVVVITLGGMFGFSQNQLDQITKALGPDGEGAAIFFEQLIKVLVTIYTAIRLIGSWAERAPSGLDYQEYSTLAKYIENKYGG